MNQKHINFLTKAEKIHGNMYDYSLVEYSHPDNKIIIICPTHGQFLQTPNTHINKKIGCPTCGYANRKLNNLNKYGVENSFQYKPFQEKQQQTKYERYGNKFYTNDIKRKNTILQKYGISNFFCGTNYQEKIKQSNLEKYGVEHHKQRHIIDSISLLKDYDWLNNEYTIQQKSANKIAQELNVSLQCVCNYLHLHNIPITYTFGFSKISICWLELVMEQQHIYIRHALNHPTGEYKIRHKKQEDTQYSHIKVDGYCKETNTIYEFHGNRFHGNPKIFAPDEQCHPFNNKTAGELYQETLEREELIKLLGYNLVVVWEDEFKRI